MKILAVDTSTMSGGIALLENGNLCAEWTLRSARTHNRRLLKSIDRLLEETGWALASIDAFAVAAGPGSFTGLRIGMTTLKVLAWTMGKPYAAVSTLDALALPLCFSAGLVCALLDARKDEVYCALYRPDAKGGLSLELPYSALSPSQLAAMLAARPAEPIIFCGDGWAPYGDFLKEKLGKLAIAPPSCFHIVRAACVGELAARRFLRGESDDPVSSAPFYLRQSEAEINYPHFAERSSGKPEII
ncbi:MAG: tRNA (adenosine(37)-N6)-threonylcarbamoyltransferase complex dimerization subunit type 1 TsaB [Syntrophobacteraceae bacterium]|nr:tRNA (adenosine(37)-N6)-threonylcarbamoyltransferase complex dimerization subunit type 1 TsaB [Syntrophobacteraceae bacterium]